MNQREREIRKYLSVIKRAIAYIEANLEPDDNGLIETLANETGPRVPAPENTRTHVVADNKPSGIATGRGTQSIRAEYVAEIMGIKDWPPALPGHAVATPTEADQINRANAVLDAVLAVPLAGKNFLDFGCGAGWIASESCNRGTASSTGYDIEVYPEWSQKRKGGFTSRYSDLVPGFYDVIMLYDVLDHCEDPAILMEQVRKCLAPGGTIYVRCHPWTSRHGNHLYKRGLNRAYIHLFLNETEIQEITKQPPFFTRKEMRPSDCYSKYFKAFEIKKENFIKEPVEDFFNSLAMRQHLMNEIQVGNKELDHFLKTMEIQMVDFVLKAK